MTTSSYANSIKIVLIDNEIDTSDAPKEISVPLKSTFNAIFDNYETENNVQHKKLQYFYRGRLIKGIETPASLNMKDGAKIEIINSNSNYTNQVNKSKKITLTLVDPDGYEHTSEIKFDRKIRDWLKNQCSNLNLTFESLSFFMNDEIIDIDRTPHQLKLSSNDKIYAKNRIKISDVNDKCHQVQTNVYTPPTNTTPLANKKDTFITINIKTPDHQTIKTTVDPNDTFKHSFKSFLKQHSFDVTKYYLLYGKIYINGKETPAHLQMKDGDYIKLKKKERCSHYEEEEPSTKDDSLFSSCLLI